MFSVELYSLRFFFFNDTATTEIYTLSLHDALPICDVFTRTNLPVETLLAPRLSPNVVTGHFGNVRGSDNYIPALPPPGDRKSTRLNSSHANISYAVFCLKKKKID